MCVLSFLSFHIGFLKKYRLSFAILGLISNLIYLIYPAGVMWHQVGILSYRTVQTLTFHSLMSIYGILTVSASAKSISFRKCYRELAVITSMTAWAMLGNYVYNGIYDGKYRLYNWFFVVRDPFYIIPENISPFIMPIVNITAFFALEMLIYLIAALIRKAKR